VKVQFTYDIRYREAAQLVINRLNQLGPLPNGAQPFLSPTSPIGEIFRYRVVGPPGFTVTDLKTIQDWILERRFKAIPGVSTSRRGAARARPTTSRRSRPAARLRA
jgi:cobalt-zinc-cadmium resistance protein CzcA